MYGDAALVLGAGFSKPAGGPLLRDLLADEVIAQSDADPNVLADLSALVQLRQTQIRTTTLEDVFTEVWREASTGGSIAGLEAARPASELLDGLVLHLSSVCSRVRLRRSTNLWTNYLRFFDDLYEHSRSLTTITFNYDMLVEQILNDLDLRFEYGPDQGIQFEDSRRRRRLRQAGPQLHVMKLHGSVNWGVCRGCSESGRAVDLVTAFEKAYVPPPRRRCPACEDKVLKAGIVPPILGKAGQAQSAEPIWKAARKALRQAREIIIIGYSMPDADVEAKSLLREVRFLGSRPRVRIVCGPNGAPFSYNKIFARFTDVGVYTEEFLSRWPEET